MKLIVCKTSSMERQTDSIVNRVQHRQFLVLDYHKQSQPQKLDDFPSSSPRNNESIHSPPVCSNTKPVIIHVEDEDGLRIQNSSNSPSLDSEELVRKPSQVSEKIKDDDVKSQISFIMKERLHTMAKEVQRRTSAVRESLMQETTEETISTASFGGPIDEHRPSLMSLIGLQKESQGDKSDEEMDCRWLPRSLHPHGQFYMMWLFLVTSAFLYNAFCIPLRSSYPYQSKSNLVYWLTLDYICDFIYLIDMILIKPRLRFMRGGISVKTRNETLRHYLVSSMFKLDLLAILPTDLIYIYSGPTPIWRLNKLAKIQSFWQLFDLLDNSFSSPSVIRVTRTLSYMIYIIHCNSCIYYLLSAWQAFGQIAYYENGKWYLNKWVYNNQGNAYIRCFYFTAAVATSTGNNPAPTNVIEYVYMTCSWMMGVFVFALLLGQIRDIVSNANRTREEYRRHMDMALSECKRLGLSKELTNKVRDWFIYTWEQQKTLDEKKLIEKLPLKLQTDLALSVHYNTLSKVQLFQDCDRTLLRDLVLKLRPVIYLPGDMICKKGSLFSFLFHFVKNSGDVGKEMYIVNQGVLQVVGGDNNEKVFAELVQGSVFGEISLLAIGGNNRRTASIRAKGYATLFVLAKEDLNDVIKYYPQAQVLLKRKAA
ncbi:cyclic nucleotide-binding domain protein [Dictyocaulus viviparus]|uniref:Cyclic nucleotide-binding domain protein n=1 Tax=Dictyocaulus viviparus TaxID=29172 RepID=A0A0D8Y9W8_DICVI|nr:cyclic nucleotide-binding domain protein [Dictyocaulus viviparus]